MYHKEQSTRIERMSIFRVIFVLFLFSARPSPENKFDDVLEEWEADDRPDNRPDASGRPHKVGGKTEKIHRFDLDDLG
ncbi:MAG: hypothetical protein M0C28_28400 [Candidatus Moduliflexus flocculans]|nr:hypothetical protein [Candidatus Moduliflexus flocculans]